MIIEDEPLAKTKLENDCAAIPFLEIVGSVYSPREAMVHPAMDDVQLFISDIQMPDIKGIDFLKSLAVPPAFIFVTADPSFAVQSYDLNVIDYVLKPYTLARLLQACNKARAFLQLIPVPAEQTDKNGFITTKDGYKHAVIYYKDIKYVQAFGNYVRIVTDTKIHTEETTLKKLSISLPSKSFIQSHKSYIVNVEFVQRVDTNQLILKGAQEKIPIGDHFKKEVRRRFIWLK
ncbi:two component transcriptional regulator, LytTR family [bacterium A37T11]|nr:two component transcriptional regulator, LytTR family [bacterium A37T11]